LHALISATMYVHDFAIPGAIVECGVWRGGSMHAVARTLDSRGDRSRELYLFDTFEGMTDPTQADRTMDNTLARTHLTRTEKGTGCWCYAGLGEVQANMALSGYPGERIHS